MRTTFGWAVMAAGMVAFGMFLGAFSRGGSTAPMMTLGILGVGVTVAGGRSVAKARRRAARDAAAADKKRRRTARKLRSILLIAFVLAAALAGAILVRKYF